MINVIGLNFVNVNEEDFKYFINLTELNISDSQI